RIDRSHDTPQKGERMKALARLPRVAGWLTVVTVVTILVTVVAVQADTTQTYLVLYKSQAVPKDAASAIARAGGVLVASYDQIGVAVARSGSATFSAKMLKDRRVEGAVAT